MHSTTIYRDDNCGDGERILPWFPVSTPLPGYGQEPPLSDEELRELRKLIAYNRDEVAKILESM